MTSDSGMEIDIMSCLIRPSLLISHMIIPPYTSIRMNNLAIKVLFQKVASHYIMYLAMYTRSDAYLSVCFSHKHDKVLTAPLAL